MTLFEQTTSPQNHPRTPLSVESGKSENPYDYMPKAPPPGGGIATESDSNNVRICKKWRSNRIILDLDKMNNDHHLLPRYPLLPIATARVGGNGGIKLKPKPTLSIERNVSTFPRCLPVPLIRMRKRRLIQRLKQDREPAMATATLIPNSDASIDSFTRSKDDLRDSESTSIPAEMLKQDSSDRPPVVSIPSTLLLRTSSSTSSAPLHKETQLFSRKKNESMDEASLRVANVPLDDQVERREIRIARCA